MPSQPLPAHRLAPRLLGLGLLIALAAQFWSTVPVAGAIAACAWGTAFGMSRPWAPAMLATYAPLTGLAVAAQVHPASPVDPSLGMIDAVAAMLLIVLLARYCFSQLVAENGATQRRRD